MTHPSANLRSIVIYGICVSLALFLGYLLANPLQWSSLVPIVIILSVLLAPLLLRFHHPLLLLGWNATMIVFFLPGAPAVWLPLTAISLVISIFRRCVDQGFRFISVREVAIPLILFAVVVIGTAEATGGIKLRSFGSEVYGGKRYFFILGAIAGYFALSAHRIPLEKAKRYLGFFLLGGTTILIGDVFYFQNPSLQFIYWLFPPDINASQANTIVRFAGINSASAIVFSYMLARYGIREIVTFRHPFRFVILVIFAVSSLFGGFRSVFINLAGLFLLQFFLEGLHRTRLFPLLILGTILAAAISIPFVKQLPYSVQRTLALLPIEVDPVVRMDADNSSEWRVKMWKSMLPQIPKYLLLGRGFALTSGDYDFSLSTYTGSMTAFSEDQGWAAVSGEYHNGPLSVIITFGIWGAIAVIWFLVAAIRVLYRNYRYGDPGVRVINTFLLAAFIIRTLMFIVVVGGIQYDLQAFAGYVAMSIALNGGVAKPVRQPVPDGATSPFDALLRPRTAFEQIT